MTIIAFDDTDSRKGMCTTYLMAQFILRLEKEGLYVVGYPGLVRLNPNVPYKTRGNGALCVQLGIGDKTGRKFPVMRWKGETIHGFSTGSTNPGAGERAFEIASEVVEEMAEINENGTNPGIVFFPHRPPRDFYLRALRGVVEIGEAEEFIREHGGRFRGFKSGRGIIGAAAASAWTPADRTFELIAYRRRERFGKRREISEESVVRMDRAFPSTFNNYDYRNRHVAIAPSSPCPVLFGIRGLVPADLIEAAGMIEGEGAEGFVIYETNQGTDEHLIERQISDVRPYQSVVVEGSVVRGPVNLPGGHVVFALSDSTGEMECTAYEPTKEFRDAVRELVPGDRVRVCGGVREEPFTINLEKIEILSLTERRRKVSNPACPECGIRMKSLGSGQGYRCRRCGRRAPEEAAEFETVEPGIREGWYEVPVCARRHLSRPLGRMPCVP